jgi:AcrR family transcriptional regulator
MNKAVARNTKTADRRQQIIQAALRCFTELGFSETTMEEIRKRSGASTGSIYHHYRSKEELAAAVYQEGLASYQQGFIEMLNGHAQAKQGILGIVRYHLGWVEHHPDWARYLFNMRRADFTAVAEPRIGQHNKEFIKQVGKWFCVHIDAQRIRKLPIDIYTSLIVGPCQEFAREWLIGVTRTNIDEACRKIGAAVWRAVSYEPDK